MSHPVSYKLKSWQGVLLFSFCLFWLWLGCTVNVPAAADLRLESRLNRLESEFSRLSTQVNRTESQLSIPQRPPQRPINPPPAVSAEPSLAAQFDNLANLAVETKLQVRQLETRINRLEQAVYGAP